MTIKAFMSRGLLIGMVVLLGGVCTDGANYYVDAHGGSDSATGMSPARAWRTLHKVNGFPFQPGDTVYFKGGCSWSGKLAPQGSGTAENRITFTSYGTGRPRIDGSGQGEAILIEDMAYVTVENFELTNIPPGGQPDRVARGIHIFTEQNQNFPGIIIRNNDIHDVIGWVTNNRWRNGAIFVRAMSEQGHFDNLLIEGNTIYNCTVRGIQGGDGQNVRPYWHKNFVVRNNHIDNVGMEGIKIHDADGVLIEYNTVYRCGNYTLSDTLDGVLAAVWSNARDVTIQYNEVAYTQIGNPPHPSIIDSEAFDIDFGTKGVTLIQYNYTHDNLGGFFLHMGDPGPDFEYGIIRYNVSVNDGKGFDNRLFELHSHADGQSVPIAVYNNTFFNDERIWVSDRNGGTGVHPGIEFRNNIFYAPAGQYDDPAHIVYENNLYYSHPAPAADVFALGVNPLLVNAGFVGDGRAAAAAYQLQPNSPARAVGKIISDNGGRDFWENRVPDDFPPDIGAHQLSRNPINYPPVAMDDTYVLQNRPSLNIAPPGVLGNDTDANNDSLLAELVHSPTNGAVTVQADGLVIYTPEPDFTGVDTFTYRAWDGQAYGSPGTVEIAVGAAPLSARWAFNHSLADVTGNGYDGSPLGDPVFTVGAQEGKAALCLDGANDAVDIAAMDLGERFTITAWIRPFSVSTYNAILCNGAGGGSFKPGFRFYIFNGKLIFEAGNGAEGSYASSYDDMLADNTWYFVAVVVDRAEGQAVFYVDGLERTQSGSIRDDFPVDRALRIGETTSGGLDYHGIIDDMRIYPDLLNPARIAGIMNECPLNYPGDLDGNCRVNSDDLLFLTAGWLKHYRMDDFESLARNWWLENN